MVKKWTKEEKEFLKKHYPPKNEGPKFVAEKLGRPYTSVMTMARKLQVRSKKNTKWEEWHIQYLKDYYGYIHMSVLQKKLGKSYSAILEKVQIHHLSRRQSLPFTEPELERLREVYPNKSYTKVRLERIFQKKYDHIRKAANSIGLYREHIMSSYEENYIKKNYKTKSTKQIAEELGLNKGVVKWQKRKLNLKRGNCRPWTEEEKTFLISNFGKLTNKQIAERLERTVRSVIHYSRKTGVNTNKLNPWTDEEIEFVLKHNHRMTSEEMSGQINRSASAITTKVLELLAGSPEKLQKRKTKSNFRKKLS